MRRVIVIAMVLALAPLTGACTPAAPLDTLRVAVYPTTDMLPMFVMEKQGIAARHGFVVKESEPFGGGLPAAEAVANDTVDVAYPGTVPIMSLAGAGKVPSQITVVGVNTVATASARAGALLVGPAIASWSDLSGRQIATHNKTSISAASFAARAKAEGVTDYEFVIVGFADMGLAVRDGTVAAAITDEPWTTQSLLRGDGGILGFTQGEAPLLTVPITAIVARSEMVAQPDLLKRFLRAHVEAVRYIHDHPAEARALLQAKLGVSQEVAGKMTLKEWPLDARLDMTTLLALERTLTDAGAIDTAVDQRTFYAPETLESVLGSGG